MYVADVSNNTKPQKSGQKIRHARLPIYLPPSRNHAKSGATSTNCHLTFTVFSSACLAHQLQANSCFPRSRVLRQATPEAYHSTSICSSRRQKPVSCANSRFARAIKPSPRDNLPIAVVPTSTGEHVSNRAQSPPSPPTPKRAYAFRW